MRQQILVPPSVTRVRSKMHNDLNILFPFSYLQDYFRLQSQTSAVILVNARLDYEKVKNVQVVLEVLVSSQHF